MNQKWPGKEQTLIPDMDSHSRDRAGSRGTTVAHSCLILVLIRDYVGEELSQSFTSTTPCSLLRGVYPTTNG